MHITDDQIRTLRRLAHEQGNRPLFDLCNVALGSTPVEKAWHRRAKEICGRAWRVTSLVVRCPKCASEPHHSCRAISKIGGPRTRTHTERVAFARARFKAD